MRAMLRIALARNRTGSPVAPTTRMPAASLPTVRPLFNVSRMMSYANTTRNDEHDRDRLHPTRASRDAPTPTASAMMSATWITRVEEAGEKS